MTISVENISQIQSGFKVFVLLRLRIAVLIVVIISISVVFLRVSRRLLQF